MEKRRSESESIYFESLDFKSSTEGMDAFINQLDELHSLECISFEDCAFSEEAADILNKKMAGMHLKTLKLKKCDYPIIGSMQYVLTTLERVKLKNRSWSQSEKDFLFSCLRSNRVLKSLFLIDFPPEFIVDFLSTTKTLEEMKVSFPLFKSSLSDIGRALAQNKTLKKFILASKWIENLIDETFEFAKAFETNTTLQHAEFVNFSFEKGFLFQLASALCINTSLSHLKLDSKDQRDVDFADAWCEMFQKNKTLETFIVYNWNMSSHDFMKLAQSFTSLKKLILVSDVLLSGDHQPWIEVLLQNAILKTVEIRGYNLEDACTCYRHITPTLEHLALSRSDKWNVAKNAWHLPPHLKVVNCYANQIKDEDFGLWCQNLETNTTLSDLDMSRNHLTFASMRMLETLMTKNRTLKILFLNGNNIGDKGARIMKRIFAQNSSLEIVELEKNDIGDRGACYLARGLVKNFTLKTLVLTENTKIGDQGYKAFSQFFRKNIRIYDVFLDEPTGENEDYNEMEFFRRQNQEYWADYFTMLLIFFS
jgi:Ran GTPase-activating protein (RanGAP) involved in mRNA processing and transport